MNKAVRDAYGLMDEDEQFDALVQRYLAHNEEAGWEQGIGTDTFSPYYRVELERHCTELHRAGKVLKGKASRRSDTKGYGHAYYPKTPKMTQSMSRHVGDLLSDDGDAKATIESVLMEMPRFVVPGSIGDRKSVDAPPPQEFDYFAEVEPRGQGDSERGWVTAVRLRPVDTKQYGYKYYTVDIDPVMYDSSYLNFQDWHKSKQGKEILQKYASEIEAVKSRVTDDHSAKVSRMRSQRALEVPVDRPETITLGKGEHPFNLMQQMGFNRKFRWASGGQNPSNRADTVIGLMKAAKPGEKVIKLIADREDRRAVYILLSPEEEVEFKRMLQMKARRKVDQAMGEAVLMEMPRHMIGPAGKARVTYHSEADCFDGAGFFKCSATAYLSSGDEETFTAAEPMSEAERAEISMMTSAEIEAKHGDRLEAVMLKAVDEARAWIKANDKPPVSMEPFEHFTIQGSGLPVVNDFRYVSAESLNYETADAVAQLGSVRKPGDVVVKLDAYKRGSNHKLFYVLLSPEELIEFKRRVVLANRNRVSQELASE